MRPALLLFNPRAIPQAMRAFDALRIPQIRLVAMTEQRISERWDEVLHAARDFSHLIAISDDAIVTPHALRSVLTGLSDDRVVSGWSNLDESMTQVNLSDSPLTALTPTADAYDMPTVWDVLEGQPRRRTFFSGMCLTAMSVAMWERYPFKVYGDEPGFASDYSLSYRLGQDEVPIVAHKAAFVRHLKAAWSEADRTEGREMLIGEIPEAIIVR